MRGIIAVIIALAVSGEAYVASPLRRMARVGRSRPLACESAPSDQEQQRLAAALVKAANNQESGRNTEKSNNEASNSSLNSNSVANSAPKDGLALSQAENSAFDVGLLIAAPIIIGTLGLFFVFPLLIPSLQNSLPPVGTP